MLFTVPNSNLNATLLQSLIVHAFENKSVVFEHVAVDARFRVAGSGFCLFAGGVERAWRKVGGKFYFKIQNSQNCSTHLRQPFCNLTIAYAQNSPLVLTGIKFLASSTFICNSPVKSVILTRFKFCLIQRRF